MTIAIDTQNKIIELEGSVTYGELVDFMEKHFEDKRDWTIRVPFKYLSSPTVPGSLPNYPNWWYNYPTTNTTKGFLTIDGKTEQI